MIKRPHLNSIAPTALAALIFGAASPAASAQAPTEPAPLFAPDLGNAINSGGVWSVEDGIFSASEDQFLWTENAFENFVLDLEFRNSEGTNSGVVVYCSDTDNWIPNSVEIQIADDYAKQWKNADPSWQAGAFFGHKPAVQQGVVAPPGQWNRMTVTASGPLIAVELNGLLVNAIDLSQYTSAKVAPGGTEIPAWLSTPWSELATRGRIGFQGKHAGAPIEFRNLQIRSLNTLERSALKAITGPLPQATRTGLVLGDGVNISHWLSQRGSRTIDPRQYFAQDDVAFLAEQGFDHIRLPIEESVMWSEDGSPNETAFETLDQAIGWIRDAGLTAIVDLHIVNSHHFNASNQGGANTLFTEEASQQRLVDLWADLSSRLKKWDNDFLAYEILNEAVADDPEDWNRLLERNIAAIREREPERPIVIGSNRWQMASTFPQLRIPADDPNLILSFHFYSPFFFTHYGASWVGDYSAYDGPVHYPGQLVTDAELDALPEGPLKDSIAENQGPHDKESLRDAMFPAIEFARLHQLPLYCGEWGAYQAVPRNDSLRWYQDISEILQEEGIQHAIWDYQGGFGIKDFSTGEIDQELIDAILRHKRH